MSQKKILNYFFYKYEFVKMYNSLQILCFILKNDDSLKSYKKLSIFKVQFNVI